MGRDRTEGPQIPKKMHRSIWRSLRSLSYVPWALLLVRREVTVSAATKMESEDLHFVSLSANRHLQRTGLRPGLSAHPREPFHAHPSYEQDRRILVNSIGEGFVPLDCNDPPCQAGDSTWLQDGYDGTTGTVIIPCGRCVVMDYGTQNADPLQNRTNTLILPHGLDIQGTLTFPEGYRLLIQTPFVRVQGVWQIKATQPVTNQPSIQIMLTGQDENLTAFVPAGANAQACAETTTTASRPATCQVGIKPVVVAGGRLDLQGMADTCKTWVSLEDVVAETNIPVPAQSWTTLPPIDAQAANLFCRTRQPYMDESFNGNGSLIEQPQWTAGYGARYRVDPIEQYLTVYQRKSALDHGPTWDLVHIRECLVSYQTYLFSARVRLRSSTTLPRGTPTSCATNNRACLTLQSTVRLPNSQIGRRKGWETPGNAFVYDIWQPFYSIVTFDSNELSPNTISHLLQLIGPDPEVELDLDDVKFYLPPAALVPDPQNVCGGDLIRNGNAQASQVHPFPVTSSGGRMTVVTESDAQFFRVDLRSRDTDSVAFSLDPPGCFVAGAKYQVSARVRVLADADVVTLIVMRTFYADSTLSRVVMASCLPSRQSWIPCQSNFTLSDNFNASSTVTSIRISFETIGAPNAVVEIDDWHLQFVQGAIKALLVQEQGVTECWGAGADVLITSPSLEFNRSQIRRLVRDPVATNSSKGTAMLFLDKYIAPTITRQDDAEFAVEVALLSRNIVFNAAKDEIGPLLGGHLIILHTPIVAQVIQGVEFRNFGRQGELGRYPIHFHLCGDVEGSVVDKNSIRNSNQRCVVVHGTHNLTVSENVAFETKGHCFMTEDGGEIGNTFERNLGANTRAASLIVRQGETDGTGPSTFWMSNPMNSWLGNVAAGSQANGFWLELQNAVKLPTLLMPLSVGMVPRTLPLKHFQDNVAHSNGQHGLRTYPLGYKPQQEALFFNLRSYKNRQNGIFFHDSESLAVVGGVLADNRLQAAFDRADNIRMENVSIIGVTSRFQEIISSQTGALVHNDMVIGLQLYGYIADEGAQGAQIRGVRFSGFSDSRVNRAALIDLNGETRTGHFDYFTTLESIQIDESAGADVFNFDSALSRGVRDAYYVDLDSSLKPAGWIATSSSTILQNTNDLMAFANMTQCDLIPEGSYLYCRDVCFRTMNFEVSPTEETLLVQLKISDATDPNRFHWYPGRYYYETLVNDSRVLDIVANTHCRKRRVFAAALPPGRYVAEFVHTATGVSTWPTFVETLVQPTSCLNTWSLSSIEVVETAVPTIGTNGTSNMGSDNVCHELIRNGDMESDPLLSWLHQFSGVVWVKGGGINGSQALADLNQNSAEGWLGQYLDTRCLTIGRLYRVRAWVRLLRNGQGYDCTTGPECPSIRLRIRSLPLGGGSNIFSNNMTGSSTALSNSMKRTVLQEYTMSLGPPHGPTVWSAGGWNLLEATMTVDHQMAGGQSIFWGVRRGTARVQMFLDNVSVQSL